MIHNKVLQFKGWILVILAMENIVVLSDILLVSLNCGTNILKWV